MYDPFDPLDTGDDELASRLVRFDRASELTGPVGTAAAAIVFTAVVRDQVPSERLALWAAAVSVATGLMVLGMVLRRRFLLALPGYVLAGLAWGGALLLGVAEWSVDDQFLWICIAFQFANTAGVMSGQTYDQMLGQAVVVTMWSTAAVMFLVVGHPLLAVAAVVFVLIVYRDLALSTRMVHELVALRSEASRRAERAASAALLDPLTGLLNRAGLESALAGANDVGAAMFIDLDRFKEINDRLGHHVGDRVLMGVADRLRTVFRSHDLVARLGGDEFLVVLSGRHDTELLADRAASVIDVLESPIDVDGEMILCSASVGVAEIPPGLVDAEQVMRESDHAMYRAKRGGRRRAVLFGDELRDELRERAELTAALRRAVRADEIEVWGQPIVRVADSRVATVELLARWRTPEGTWIPPSRFIPVAEEIGASGVIARLVLERAERLFDGWRDHPVLGSARIGVNASAVDLGDRSFVDDIRAVPERAGVAPGRLVIEITESTSLDPEGLARRHLELVAGDGIAVVLDDFGTGYSSISGLLGLPLDAVKVDRSLVSSMDDDPRVLDVVRSITDLVRTLGRRMVAEGVESARQLEVVRELGFDEAQGYYLCPPMPLGELAGEAGSDRLAWLASREGPLPFPPTGVPPPDSPAARGRQ